MQRINGAYLYELAEDLRVLSKIKVQDTPRSTNYFDCLTAKDVLKGFLFASIFSGSFRTSATAATELLKELDYIAPDIHQNVDWEEQIYAWRFNKLQNLFTRFEAVLTAELQGTALYFVANKGGYDTLALTDYGEALFPLDLQSKTPEAVSDVKAGARCIAFELFTAAAFHFHRANEAVLRRYFDEVAGAGKRPKTNNMGDYLKKLRELGLGDPKVIAVLQSIKDLHRNPIMHPEEQITTAEEAISLLSAIRASIGYMTDRISTEPPPVIAPLPLEGGEGASEDLSD